MPSLSFESDYGKWKYFDLSGGGKLTTEFSWADPDGLPKPVLQTFTKVLTDKIKDLMKGDDKRAEAIRKQIGEWEKKLGAADVKSGRDLTAFVASVNTSLSERFPGISGGADGVARLLAAQTEKALPKDVAAALAKTAFKLKCKVVGTLVLAVSIAGLSVAAAVLTGGLAMPIAAAALSGAMLLGKSGVAAYKSLKAAQDCSIALAQILEQQRSTAKAIQDTVSRAESQLFTLQAGARAAATEAAALQKQLNEIKAIYGRKEVDGVEILSNISAGAIGEINTLQGKLDAWNAKSAAAEAATAKFAGLLATVKRAFDQSQFDTLANENWKTLLGEFANTYGSDIQVLVTGAQSLAKLVAA